MLPFPTEILRNQRRIFDVGWSRDHFLCSKGLAYILATSRHSACVGATVKLLLPFLRHSNAPVRGCDCVPLIERESEISKSFLHADFQRNCRARRARAILRSKESREGDPNIKIKSEENGFGISLNPLWRILRLWCSVSVEVSRRTNETSDQAASRYRRNMGLSWIAVRNATSPGMDRA
jgi:hypothetical protein